jgi:2-polyprenyl-3-methyl-5-hydroxy-6-metoxy-1,4-benzoquinol methylase
MDQLTVTDRALASSLHALAGPRTHGRVVELLTASPQCGRVLDLPAGTGALAVRLQAAGFEVEPADIDPEMFVAPGLTCRRADMEQPLPYAEAEFDWVVSVEGVEHLESPGAFIRECARVLRPGGRLLMTTPNVLNLPSRLRILLAGFPALMRPVCETEPDPAHDHISPLPYYQLRGLLRRAGFELLTATTDWRRRTSIPLMAAYPLIWLCTHHQLRRMQREHPDADYREIARHLLSLDLLMGRTLIVVARKPERR